MRRPHGQVIRDWIDKGCARELLSVDPAIFSVPDQGMARFGGDITDRRICPAVQAAGAGGQCDGSHP